MEAELTRDSLLAAAMGGGVIAVIVSALHPAFAVWTTLVLLFFGDQPNIPVLAFWARYLATSGVALLLAAVTIRAVIDRQRQHFRELVVFVPFTVVVIVSAFYNESSWRQVALSLATNLRYPLFFVALLNARFSSMFFERVMTWFVRLVLLQIPVTIGQFLMGHTGDAVAGTFGSNTRLGEVILFAQCVVLSRAFTKRRGLTTGWLTAFALLIPAALGDIEIVFAYFPILASVMLARFYDWRASKVLLVLPLLAPAALALVFIIVSSETLRPFLESRLDPQGQHAIAMRYFRSPEVASYASLGRVTILAVSWPLLLEDRFRIVWGFGPEAAQGTALAGPDADPELTGGVVCRELAARRVLCRESQSFKSLMEFGVLGSLLFLLPPILFWLHARPLRRATPRLRRTWILSEGMCLLYFLGFWYSSTWRLDTYGFVMAVAAASVYRIRRELRMVAARAAASQITPALAVASR